MHEIYFDHRSHQPITVSDEAYIQIQEIIGRLRVCQGCGRYYTPENPQVVLNCCLNCFQRGAGKRHDLTYIGQHTTEPNQHGDVEHKFINKEGYVYITKSETEISNDMYYEKRLRETLQHWNYPTPPEFWEVEGKPSRLHDSYMSIYGNFPRVPVVLIKYAENYTYTPSINLLFLSTKGGECREITKRKGEGLKLFREARKRAEATKDAGGDYHLYGRSTYALFDYDLHSLVADIAVEQYNRQRSEQKPLI